MFSTFFTVVSMYVSFKLVLCYFSVAERVPLQSHEHAIYQIINTEHESRPAISFPNLICSSDKEITFSSEITFRQGFRMWFCTTAKGKQMSKSKTAVCSIKIE